MSLLAIGTLSFNHTFLYMNEKELAITWLKAFVIETWKWIAFIWTHQQGKLYETTLTQNLVFQLHHQFYEKKLPFELWEALDENANGNVK